jgi:hypothetical protein
MDLGRDLVHFVASTTRLGDWRLYLLVELHTLEVHATNCCTAINQTVGRELKRQVEMKPCLSRVLDF